MFKRSKEKRKKKQKAKTRMARGQLPVGAKWARRSFVAAVSAWVSAVVTASSPSARGNTVDPAMDPEEMEDLWAQRDESKKAFT